MALRVSFKLIQLLLTSPNITKVYLLVLTIDRCEEWLKPHKMTCLRLASWTYINWGRTHLGKKLIYQRKRMTNY